MSSRVSSKKTLVFLHSLLFLYSLIAVFSKLASFQEFGSLLFFVYYGVVLGTLFFYAIAWQQILKKIPLTIAFANKAIVILWGFFWGRLLFQESISMGMVIGSVVVVAGVLLVVQDGK